MRQRPPEYSERTNHDPGDAPDVSVPFEASIWRAEVFGGLRIDVAMIDSRFVEARLPSIVAGVRGRGKAKLVDNFLEFQFGLTNEELSTGEYLTSIELRYWTTFPCLKSQ